MENGHDIKIVAGKIEKYGENRCISIVAVVKDENGIDQKVVWKNVRNKELKE